jgi:hypothetical protein
MWITAEIVLVDRLVGRRHQDMSGCAPEVAKESIPVLRREVFQHLDTEDEIVLRIRHLWKKVERIRYNKSVVCELPQRIVVSVPHLNGVYLPVPARATGFNDPWVVEVLAKEGAPVSVPATQIEH